MKVMKGFATRTPCMKTESFSRVSCGCSCVPRPQILSVERRLLVNEPKQVQLVNVIHSPL